MILSIMKWILARISPVPHRLVDSGRLCRRVHRLFFHPIWIRAIWSWMTTTAMMRRTSRMSRPAFFVPIRFPVPAHHRSRRLPLRERHPPVWGGDWEAPGGHFCDHPNRRLHHLFRGVRLVCRLNPRLEAATCLPKPRCRAVLIGGRLIWLTSF